MLRAGNPRERQSRPLAESRPAPDLRSRFCCFDVTARRAAAAHKLLCGLCLPALLAAPAAAEESPRLLTALEARADSSGVTLAWAVDESRADVISGFACVYRTPAHLELGVSGVVPCGPAPAPAEARSRTVAGLPEYGDYEFELVALEKPEARAVPWPRRALRVRVAVTEALAGAPGPGRAVSGAGPLIEGCRPDEDSNAPSWRLDQVVSDIHLTHPPGVGWSPAGDPSVAPDWPEPPTLAELAAAAGIDLEAVVGDAAAGAEAAARTIAGAAKSPAFVRASATSRALLRTRPDGGRELKLHSSYPYGDVYAFTAAHAVPGWADAAHAAAWPALFKRSDCPPAGRPNVTHDVALALTDAAGGDTRLEHSGYGWWTVAPVGANPERVLAVAAGLSHGAPATAPPPPRAAWRGRLSGHLFWNERRWAAAGDAEFELRGSAGAPRLAGRVTDLVLAPLDAETLAPTAGAGGRLPPLLFEAADAADGAWSGDLTFGAADADPGSEGFPAPDAFRGGWRASAHGPGAKEIAGRLRLWTPLSDGADPGAGWPAQAVFAAGFGATRARAAHEENSR